MTDHKFTDDDVIKALECCTLGDCFPCAYGNIGVGCRDKMNADALALILRQKREIERLNTVHADMTESLRLAAEANKDMQAEIERLKKIGDDKTSEVLRHDASIRELHKQLETARSEAIKEFAKKIKTDAEWICDDNYIEGALIKYVDTLVEEMTENKR
jgi:molecular chaperone GrpE (heat shock protein)